MKEGKNISRALFIITIAATTIACIILRYYTEFQREHYLKPAIARHQIQKIMLSLLIYKKQENSYPGTRDYNYFSLSNQNNSIPIKDPWNRDYIYISPGPEGLPYRLTSYGADGQENGMGKDEDLVSDKMLIELLKEK